MPSEQKIKQGEFDRHRRIAGDIRRSGVFDQEGCPRCGFKQYKKTFCYGLEPDMGRVVNGFEWCRCVGPHLHGECAACTFAWLERTKDDQLEREGRGAIRFDETLGQNGEIIPLAPGLLLLASPPRSEGPSRAARVPDDAAGTGSADTP